MFKLPCLFLSSSRKPTHGFARPPPMLVSRGERSTLTWTWSCPGFVSRLGCPSQSKRTPITKTVPTAASHAGVSAAALSDRLLEHFPVVPLVLVGQSSLSHFSQTFGLTVWPFQQQNIRILAFLVELVEKGRGRLLLFYWNIVDLQGYISFRCTSE